MASGELSKNGVREAALRVLSLVEEIAAAKSSSFGAREAGMAGWMQSVSRAHFGAGTGQRTFWGRFGRMSVRVITWWM
jgi:hypothetical protein